MKLPALSSFHRLSEKLSKAASTLALWMIFGTLGSTAASAQTPAPQTRDIHRDLPLSAAFDHALIAGTRDSSGHPGDQYWQLWTDYTIYAKLDPQTATVMGRETVVVHNPGPDTIASIMLRLEQNRFRRDGTGVGKLADSNMTEGMIITRLTVDGQIIPLKEVEDLTTTVARVPGAIPARGSSTLEVDWHFQVPYRGGRVGRPYR